MKETKSFLQKNILLFVALGVFVMFILFLLTNKSAPSLSLSDASAASESVYRFWSDPYQSHFYTVSKFERDFVRNNDKNWIYEGVVFDAFARKQPNSNPVYRFWNANQKSHFYTQSEVEREKVRAQSEWRYEGIAYYTLGKSAGSTPVYRLYSPSKNAHYYVNSESEKNALVAGGNWNLEGIAFYSKKVAATPVVPVNPVDPVDPPTPTNGSCGTNDDGTFDTAPTTQLCAAGSATSVSGSGPWSWSCQGSNGGSTDQCSAQKTVVVTAQCADGIDNDNDGVTDLADTDCSGADDDTESGSTPSNGVCGTADETSASSIPPSTSLCSTGTVQNQSTSGDQFTWSCQGENGGASDNCQMTLTTVTPVNGQCGSSNEDDFNSAPATNLCNAGAPTDVSGSGPWTWSCNGSDGGTTSSCTAQKIAAPTPKNGQCGSSIEGTHDTAPSINLCTIGEASSVTGSGPWNWSCSGVDGGSASNCIGQKTPPEASNCGIDDGEILTGPPQNPLCQNGLTAADETGSGPWLWTCRDNTGAFVTSCRAELEGDTGDVQGQCGSAINACAVGDFIDAEDTAAQHIWGCIGSGGFSTFADCTMDK